MSLLRRFSSIVVSILIAITAIWFFVGGMSAVSGGSVADSDSHKVSQSQLGSLQKATDFDRRCQDNVDGSLLARQAKFIADDDHKFARNGDVAYYHLPDSGVTLSYDINRCTFGVAIESRFQMTNGQLRELSLDRQVTFIKTSDGTVLSGAKVQSTCSSTKSPLLPAAMGRKFFPIHVFCDR